MCLLMKCKFWLQLVRLPDNAALIITVTNDSLNVSRLCLDLLPGVPFIGVEFNGTLCLF